MIAAESRVAYTAAFVQTVGGHSYGIAERRGTVLALDERVACVKWDDEPDRPQNVLLVNLAEPGPNVRFR